MSIRRLFPIILVSLLALLAVAAAPDPDMWWHLRTGEFIVHHGIPRTDVFSHTVAGTPWTAHEWLTDVLMWATYRVSGFTGLVLLFAAVVVVAFWITYLTCDGRPYVACLVVSLSACVAFFSIGVRPQVMNLLLFATFIFVVERFKDRSSDARASDRRADTRELWILPVLSALWANLHGGFMLGVAVLATYVAGEGLQAWLGRRDHRGLDGRGIRRLTWMAVACLGAALLTPHGIRLLSYSADTLGAFYVAKGWVVEWASPNFHEPPGWPFAAALGLGVAAWAFNPRRAPVTDVLLFSGTAAAGLYSARHMALFAIAAAPTTCRAIVSCIEGTSFHAELTGASPEPETPGVRKVLHAAVAAGMVLLAAVHAGSRLRGFDHATKLQYPVAAVDFLEREQMTEQRCFNTYGWGGYLIWRGIPPFIDGRADVYGDAFIRTFVSTNFAHDDWRRPLDAYGVDYALIHRDSLLRTVMLESREWREVYRDHIAAVLVRSR